MRERFAPYAPAVLWAGVIVLLLSLVIVLFGGRGPVPTEYMLVAGAALVVIAALLRPDALRQMLGIRGVRYGGNALVISLGFIAILGLINYLGTQQRFNFRKDFTANQQFTLSQQTIQILESLKQPVKATAFFVPPNSAGPGTPGKQEAEDRLREYALHSANFSYEFVDPATSPDLVQDLQVTHEGGIVFSAGGKKQEAISSSESDLTAAIIKVTTDKPRSAYFLTGNQERDPNDTGDDGFSFVRQFLEKDNYAIATQNLVISTTIPSTATVAILARPRTPLAAEAVKAISDYLDQGGRLLVMSDPRQPDPLPGVLDKWGVQFRNDQVIDPGRESYIQNPQFPAVAQYPFSSITQKMNGLVTVFPNPRSIKKLDPAPNGITAQAIVQTSADSWGETTLDLQTAPPKYDEGKDTKGPLDLIVTVEGSAPISATTPVSTTATPRKTRLIVAGNSEFVANRTLQATLANGLRNIDLFTNSINWLAEEEALISIRPTPPDQRTVVMTAGQTQTVGLLTVVVLPALVLLAGLSVWWRRR